MLTVRCRGLESPESWAGLFPTYAASPEGMQSPDVVLDTDPIPGWLNPRRLGDGKPAWSSTWTKDELHLEGPDLHGVVRKEGSSLRGSLTADSDGPWSLAFTLRSVLHQAIAGRGLLLHASGVMRDGRLYLFAGHAGAGK